MLTLKIIKPTAELPTNYNGLPVVRAWSDIGAHNRMFKASNVVKYGEFRLCLCPNGYVLLCGKHACKGLMYFNNLCKNHNNGKESYTYCRYEGCVKTASCGHEWKKPLYCSTHKIGDMINVVNKRCSHHDCEIIPKYGYEGGKAEYCVTHKLNGMIDVAHSLCEHQNCKISSSYGYKEGPVQFCSKHKHDGMINLIKKNCIAHNCGIIPLYGYKEGSAQYCAKHKLDGMVNIKRKRCEKDDCEIIPSYGYRGGPAQYCNNHKLDGMINVSRPRCEYIGCEISRGYGYVGGPAQYCVTHKLTNMIDVSHKKCEYFDCTIQAGYSYLGGSPQFCTKHKLDDMIDVVNKRCRHENCGNIPNYKKLFTTINTHCGEHLTLNEYGPSKSNPMCRHIGCNFSASFIDCNDVNIYPIRCQHHKFPTDIELIFKLCPNCNDELYFPVNRELCMNCGLYREKTLYHFKELEIKYLLQSNNIDFVHDKRVSQNGSKKRPDFLVKSSFGYLIIEVDEYQHKDYPRELEEKRMRKIYNDIQLISLGAEVLFVRYNPDEYKGLQIGNKYIRQRTLYETILWLKDLEKINTPLSKMVLFYDGFNGERKIELV